MPDGIYEKDEDGAEGNIRVREEVDIKATSELVTPENWLWLRPCFLPSGNLESKTVADENDEENMENKEKVEVTVERLQKLDADKDKDNWKLTLQGLADVHKIDNKDLS